jgi:non-specific serine/threonine protein kinase
LLDEAARQAAWAAGHAMTAAQAIRYAQAPAEPASPRQPPPPPASRLTPRERQVAALVARGLTNKEIADELVITEGTAAVHVEHIRTKLRLRSRAQVAVWAAEQGLLTTPPDWEDPSDLPATGPASRTRR